MSLRTSSCLFEILTHTWGTAVNAKVPIKITSDCSGLPANSMDAVVLIQVPFSESEQGNDVLYAEDDKCIGSRVISALRNLEREQQQTYVTFF